jgi:hypothetical protein
MLVPVEMAGTFEPFQLSFEVKAEQILVHLQHVMLVSHARTDNITRAHVIFDAFGHYPGMALDDVPYFIGIMIMEIKGGGIPLRDTE